MLTCKKIQLCVCVVMYSSDEVLEEEKEFIVITGGLEEERERTMEGTRKRKASASELVTMETKKFHALS